MNYRKVFLQYGELLKLCDEIKTLQKKYAKKIKASQRQKLRFWSIWISDIQSRCTLHFVTEVSNFKLRRQN